MLTSGVIDAPPFRPDIDLSILVPDFHREKAVVDPVRSALAASVLSIEVIVADDRPAGPAADAMASIADPRLRYLMSANRESAGGDPARVRNDLVSSSGGRYLYFLDDDDNAAIDTLDRIVDEMQAADVGVGIGIGKVCPSGPDGRHVVDEACTHHRDARLHFTQRPDRFEVATRLTSEPSLVCCSACVIRRDVFDAIGGFQQHRPRHQDADLYVRAIRGHGYVHVDPDRDRAAAFPIAPPALARARIETAAPLGVPAAPRSGRGTVDGKLDILLTHGSYLGTLAAARFLGRQGHRVIVADHGKRSSAQHSRHVAEGLSCPNELDFDAVAEWLDAFGRARPGCLLYPCSDDMAWVIAAQRDRLAAHFVMLQPPLATIETLLNKHKLYALCGELGIPTPETYYPQSAADVAAIAAGVSGRFLVKPKTQIGLQIKNKAAIAEAGPDLVAQCGAFHKRFRYIDAMTRHDPALGWPMIQRFDPAASTKTVSIAGFRSEDGRVFEVLSSQKILQFPIRIGIGLCFASVDVDPELADRVRRICEASGYYGAFEVEFIRSEHGDLLMDFNPRYYGQMQLEISRGLPIPALVLSDALKRPFPVLAPSRKLHIAYRWQLRLVMTTQALAGRISWAERRRWLDLTHHRTNPAVVDSVFDRDDRAPWNVAVRRQLLSYLRHPRAAFRALFGDA